MPRTAAAITAADPATTRAQRIAWWHEARFGMFIHYGLYSLLGRGEWVMNRERITPEEYAPLAAQFKPEKGCAKAWVKLAKQAGMKYAVLTAKHHEGFCLWDSAACDFNSVNACGRDLVREFVEACRAEGLKVGIYYSLMDWRVPEGTTCARDEDARRCFLDYTNALVEELMTGYGRIDLLWYDMPEPLETAERWESDRLNGMVRRHQPHILINDRSRTPEDFGTPEEHITAQAAKPDARGWEACMTFNTYWGWVDLPEGDWHSARQVGRMLNQVSAQGGNLLLNIGPRPDGSVPPPAVTRLKAVGAWLKRHGEAVYAVRDRVAYLDLQYLFQGGPAWTRNGRDIYLWTATWPGRSLTVGAFRGEIASATLLTTGKALKIRHEADRLHLDGLPARCPDRHLGMTVIRLRMREGGSCRFGAMCEPISYKIGSAPWQSPFLARWELSLVQEPSAVAHATAPRNTRWQVISADENGFVNAHDRTGNSDGLVWLRTTISAPRDGRWLLQLGHDGGVQAFIDGQSIGCTPLRRNPSEPDRSEFPMNLNAGKHELLIALDLCAGNGWGIFARFALHEAERARLSATVVPTFPAVTNSGTGHEHDAS